MTQKSTVDRDFPSTILFPMRSSPLVCAADALEVLLLLLWYIYSGMSAPYAARLVVQQTTWRSPQNGPLPGPVAVAHTDAEQTAASSTLASQHPRAHTILFVLGVLPQAVKLFGMRGIPWTHVWGGLFLSSYLVLAGVGALARCAEGDIDMSSAAALDETIVLRLKLGMVAAVAQVGVWLWGLLSLTRGSTAFHMLLFFQPLEFLLFFFVGYIIKALPCPMVVISFPGGMYLVCRGLIFIFELGDTIQMAVSFLFICTAFTTGLIIYIRFVYPTHFRAILSILFGIANLVLSILYYRFLYDPTGTIKPNWAEKLG